MALMTPPLSGRNTSAPIYDPIRGGNGYRAGARIARVQILIALVLGVAAFSLFCVLRKKYPRIYVANFNLHNQGYIHSLSRRKLPRLPNSLFGWIVTVYGITEDQVLEHAGLDAVVFLGFFKMAIKALSVCVLFAFTVISPVRYWFTGRVDYPDPDEPSFARSAAVSMAFRKQQEYRSLIWMYTVFTYVFTFVVLLFLYKQTTKIIAMRQQYLGRQASITDRTIKILGIPPVLREDETLRRHINSLGVGEVRSVCIVKEWNVLNSLFKARKNVLHLLETHWVQYFRSNSISDITDLSNLRFNGTLGDAFGLQKRPANRGPQAAHLSEPLTLISGQSRPQISEAECLRSTNYSDEPDISSAQGSGALTPSIMDQISEHVEELAQANGEVPILPGERKRPHFKKGLFGLVGPQVDAIDYYNSQLETIDKEIRRYRQKEFPPSSTAFVTMESVAQAQMLAQAVLDPKVNHLITSLAPSPHDIIWENLCLTRRERNTRIVLVMVFIGLVSVLLVFPVRFLSNFLNIKSISKVAPQLARFLKAHRWAENLITAILPPYVFTIFNIVMPYFYIWITKRQGYTSRGDEELSAISKNFFYTFVNLFLVFTLFGTAILTDTAQLAYQLADSLQKLSLFYVDLIILQGIGIFPYKLLLLGNLIKYPIKNFFWCKTPRNYLDLYKPPVFNFGLQLPQPILILIIIVTYLVISTKILTAGLVYFLIGYFVFKYQLLYACVHPPHNTGKIWPLIVRRVMMGLIIFHTMMFGTLASEKAYACASFIIPLSIFTMYLFWHYHKNYIPLSNFIALRSIQSNNLPNFEEQAGDERHMRTLDERREFNQTYEYPNLVSDMEGALIAVDYDEALYIQPDGTTIKKPITNFQ